MKMLYPPKSPEIAIGMLDLVAAKLPAITEKATKARISPKLENQLHESLEFALIASRRATSILNPSPCPEALSNRIIQNITDVSLLDKQSSLVGAVLRNLREHKQLTVDKFSRELGLSKGFVSQVENGSTSYKLQTLLFEVDPALGLQRGSIIACISEAHKTLTWLKYGVTQEQPTPNWLVGEPLENVARWPLQSKYYSKRFPEILSEPSALANPGRAMELALFGLMHMSATQVAEAAHAMGLSKGFMSQVRRPMDTHMSAAVGLFGVDKMLSAPLGTYASYAYAVQDYFASY